jgi:hypothetical protein
MAHHVRSITVPSPIAALCPFSRASKRKYLEKREAVGDVFPDHGFLYMMVMM